MKKFMVYDIGGTFIKFAVMDQEAIHIKGQVRTPHDSLESLLETLEQACSDFINSVDGIAISMPGIINSDIGYATHGGSLRYIKNINIRDIINSHFQLPVYIENDGKSAVLGEYWKGALQNVRHGVAMVLGTGIGGGIISNGKLVKGHHFAAGEFSAIRTDALNPLSIETMFGSTGSTPYLVEKIALEIGEDIADYDGKDMFRTLRQGNKDANKIFSSYCKSIAGQILNLQSILDPELFVIGGGMSVEPMLVESIEQEINELYDKDIFLQMSGIKPKIVSSQLGNDANLYGALYQFLINNSLTENLFLLE